MTPLCLVKRSGNNTAPHALIPVPGPRFCPGLEMSGDLTWPWSSFSKDCFAWGKNWPWSGMFLLKVFIIEFKHALIWREADIYIHIFQKSFYSPSFKPLLCFLKNSPKINSWEPIFKRCLLSMIYKMHLNRCRTSVGFALRPQFKS